MRPEHRRPEQGEGRPGGFCGGRHVAEADEAEIDLAARREMPGSETRGDRGGAEDDVPPREKAQGREPARTRRSRAHRREGRRRRGAHRALSRAEPLRAVAKSTTSPPCAPAWASASPLSR